MRVGGLSKASRLAPIVAATNRTDYVVDPAERRGMEPALVEVTYQPGYRVMVLAAGSHLGADPRLRLVTTATGGTC